MRLAKPRVDVGLATDNLGPMLEFWQNEAAVPFEQVLRIRPGHEQHRHDANGSVLKINHQAEPLVGAPASGYREVIIARSDLTTPRSLVDPDGNRLRLAPAGEDGVTQIGIRLAVRDLAAHVAFYREALGLAQEPTAAAGAAFRAGETLILMDQAPDAPADAGMDGGGWRYITFQVFKVDEEHARVLAAGGRKALAPVTLGETARISMVRDPDGNWIELSQRASIVGSLDS
jgi:predicted enzyme related to lactoylglutathione lyase